MKAIGGPQKLRFSVASCSGEDADYPARELLYHSPQTRGWQSPRFCKFPQEIVLRLDKPARVQQIQILAHEFKIPTKIEVYIAPPSSATAAADQQQQLGPDGAPAVTAMRRLGYLSFDANERSGHQARELKSVHVSVDAAALRLVVHRCHVNKLNIYNQVGVVALNLIGEPLLLGATPGPGALSGVPHHHHARVEAGEVGYYNRAAAGVADLALDVHVDAVTAAKIRELSRLKDAAVAAEEYDEAKRLKAAVERLKALGGKIAQLEARKRAAVEREDYDLAKALKADIEKLRGAGDGAALAGDGVPVGGIGAAVGGVKGRIGLPSSTGGSGPLIAAYHGGGDEPAAAREASNGGRTSPGAAAAAAAEASGWGEGLRGHHDSGYHAYEERPAVARSALMRTSDSAAGASGGGGAAGAGGPSFGGGGAGAGAGAGAADALAADGAGPDADPMSVSAAALFGASAGGAAAPGGAAVAAAAPAGWPADLPAPEPVAGAAAKDAEAVAEAAGDYVAAAFFSRSWQLRDAALGHVAGLVRDAGCASGMEKRELARALARLAARAMRDKVPGVFASASGLLTALIDAMAGSPRDVAAAAELALPALVERLGESNARLRDGARDAILALARNRETGLRSPAGAAPLLRPPKSQAAWRPVLSTLQLLQELIPLIGVSQGSSGGGMRSGGGGGAGMASSSGGGGGPEGLDLHELMDYVGRAFGSANADVRAAAVKVAVLAHDAAGPAARRLLPRDLQPKIRDALDAALGGGAFAEPASPAPPQQQQQQQTATPAGRGARGTPAGAKTAAGGSASKAPRPGARTPTGAAAAARTGGTTPPPPARRAGGGGGGGAAAAAGSNARPKPRAAQQPLPPHLQGLEADDDDADAGASGGGSDDEDEGGGGFGGGSPSAAPAGDGEAARFEAELAAREARYGPAHPAVAEAASNLAIVYNQRGDYDRARPLYERALAAYEAAYGPDHRDVAHALTDLAVLHLERGDDDAGRPLLERALAIQEAALGPDHPDVAAIRDVLASDE